MTLNDVILFCRNPKNSRNACIRAIERWRWDAQVAKGAASVQPTLPAHARKAKS